MVSNDIRSTRKILTVYCSLLYNNWNKKSMRATTWGYSNTSPEVRSTDNNQCSYRSFPRNRMSFDPLSVLYVTKQFMELSRSIRLWPDGSTMRHFACALGTSRPALLHFRLIFIERRSSVQKTRCFYFHDNLYFRQDSLSLPNNSRRDVVKHAVDLQRRSC